MKKFSALAFIVVVFFTLAAPAAAQGNSPTQPVYVVKPGDTLWTIARDLHLPYGEFLSMNNLTEDSPVLPGDRLVVPGLEGLEGELTTVDLAYGESLSSLSRRYQLPEDVIIDLNRLTSPLELYAGVSVVLVREMEEHNQELIGRRFSLRQGQTTLEAAVEQGLNPWMVLQDNGVENPVRLIPGDVLRESTGKEGGPGAFPGGVEEVAATPENFSQGDTVVIRVQAPSGTQLQGSLGKHQLHFFSSPEGDWFALQGLHARAPVGILPLSLWGTLPDGTLLAHQQMVRIYSGNYPYEKLTNIPSETVNEELSASESDLLNSVTESADPKKRWTGQFGSPVPEVFSECWPSLYGNRRSFNGSGFKYFHSGLDFCGSLGQDIYAAAPGRVVYTGNLKIHGGTTVIDHGWGIYTLYAHQSQILVEKGAHVGGGDLIGQVGTTGRSTGPHLHWEVWVGGVQVDPLDWLQEVYP